MKEIKTALNHEYKGLLLYREFDKIFSSELFKKITQIRENGIKILENFCDDFSYFDDEICTPKTYEDALILAISFEIETALVYDKLTNETGDEKIKDLFFRLWATSENEYKKALKMELLSNSQNNNFGFNNLINQELKEIFAKFKDGNANQNDINKLLQNPSFPLFSGLALGGITGMLLGEKEI